MTLTLQMVGRRLEGLSDIDHRLRRRMNDRSWIRQRSHNPWRLVELSWQHVGQLLLREPSDKREVRTDSEHPCRSRLRSGPRSAAAGAVARSCSRGIGMLHGTVMGRELRRFSLLNYDNRSAATRMFRQKL